MDAIRLGMDLTFAAALFVPPALVAWRGTYIAAWVAFWFYALLLALGFWTQIEDGADARQVLLSAALAAVVVPVVLFGIVFVRRACGGRGPGRLVRHRVRAPAGASFKEGVMFSWFRERKWFSIAYASGGMLTWLYIVLITIPWWAIPTDGFVAIAVSCVWPLYWLLALNGL